VSTKRPPSPPHPTAIDKLAGYLSMNLPVGMTRNKSALAMAINMVTQSNTCRKKDKNEFKKQVA
jgi:hypothetical protein